MVVLLHFFCIFEIFTIKQLNDILNNVNINHVSNQKRNIFVQIMIYTVSNIINYFNISSIFMNKRSIIYLYTITFTTQNTNCNNGDIEQAG